MVRTIKIRETNGHEVSIRAQIECLIAVMLCLLMGLGIHHMGWEPGSWRRIFFSYPLMGFTMFCCGAICAYAGRTSEECEMEWKKHGWWRWAGGLLVGPLMAHLLNMFP